MCDVMRKRGVGKNILFYSELHYFDDLMSRSPGCVGAGVAVGGSAVSGAGALVRLAVGIITSPTAIEERVRLRQHLLNHQQLSLRHSKCVLDNASMSGTVL